MVAKIKSGKSLIGALIYNENKVKSGKAKMISTNGYTKSDDKLSFQEKLFRLTDLAERNLRTKTNTVHLSLNFDLDERIETDKLVEIVGEYMKRIGFEFQPYLTYKHFDAGHPHVHIVTTNIQADGKRISLNNIGLLKSEPARKAIEIEFGLVKASDKTLTINAPADLKLKPVNYGETDTKRAITNIVNVIAKTYKFTSLPELNAILNQYNVMADKGSKESVMFKHGGLNYWITDENGRKIGAPIKASSIYLKPTIKLLEKRFKLNECLRKPYKEKLKAKIDRAMNKSMSFEEFKKELIKDQVNMVIRQNADGRIYGLSFIDLLDKVVFNGSDLGKGYSAGAVVNVLQSKSSRNDTVSAERTFEKTENTTPNSESTLNHYTGRNLLDDLLNPLENNQAMPSQFGPKKKKKRRKLNL
ncbi:relaxase/mobilization nuclease domain-containing protein [Mucilaginibacter sp.]|uniref:relaxase/mobilization nuclease domain-containing protein n=1 Tax=Mucilaginibacter sp. TaxID=1882438 RepID=UPI0035BC6B37